MRTTSSLTARRVIYAFALAMLAGSPILAAPIRYRLIDGGAGDQGGHTLAGFIEFDSPCGENCTRANVTDFSFTVSGPSNYSYSYQSPADVFNTGIAFATPTHLYVDFSGSGALSLGNAAGQGPVLRWTASFNNDYSSTGSDFQGGWQRTPLATRLVAIGVVVPEPPMVMLAMTAGAIAQRLWRVRHFARLQA